MKRTFIVFATILLLCIAYTTAQDRKLIVHAVCFYNLENLFDTCHDAHKNDYDFLPNGSFQWNENKYTNKLANMARAICDLGTDKLPYGASIIGVSEVENDKVLDDLMAQPSMQKRGYKYVHFEGPDKRGVDCALIYRRDTQAREAYFRMNKDGYIRGDLYMVHIIDGEVKSNDPRLF